LKAAFKKRVDNGTENPLKWALYDTFRNEFLLGGFCELIAAVVQVLAPFVLRYLINFSTETWVSQRTGSPKPDIGHGIGLVFAVTILQVIQSVCTNHFLYRGMTVGGQARAVTIAVIFEKAMRLSGRARAGGKSNTEPVGLPPGITPGSKEEKKWLKAKLKKEKANAQDKKGVSGSGEGWSNGRIVNLMSTDTYRIDQASGMFHMICGLSNINRPDACLASCKHHIQCVGRLRSANVGYASTRKVDQELVRPQKGHQQSHRSKSWSYPGDSCRCQIRQVFRVGEQFPRPPQGDPSQRNWQNSVFVEHP
jgi:hypothetical protein